MRSSLEPLMSHNRGDWETPPGLFQMLDAEFHFTLDAAANDMNHLCSRWYGPGGVGEDAHELPWDGRVWCNPPYGPAIPQFVESAIFAVRGRIADIVVMLLPARTDTKWFHKIITQGSCQRMRFIKGRLHFHLNGQLVRDEQGRSVGAPFPSLIAILGGSVWLETHNSTPLWSEL